MTLAPAASPSVPRRPANSSIRVWSSTLHRCNVDDHTRIDEFAGRRGTDGNAAGANVIEGRRRRRARTPDTDVDRTVRHPRQSTAPALVSVGCAADHVVLGRERVEPEEGLWRVALDRA